jgi:hypothetical protein
MSMLVFALLVVRSGPVHAETAFWTNSTVADLAGTKVFRAPGTCALPGAYALVGTFLKPAAEGLLPDPTADGKYCHRALHYDTAGNESVFSATAEFDYNVIPPPAPTLFGVRP